MPDFWDGDPELRAQSRAERQRHRQSRAQGGKTTRDLELVRFSEMCPQLEGRPLVRGYLEREQTSLVFGDTGCGKTFLCLDLGLHVAANLFWFGRKVSQGAVVYVAAEAGRSIENRVAAFKIARGFQDKDIPFAAVTSPVDLCHTEAGDVERLVAIIRDAALGQLKLVIIDTVSRALAGGNENGPDDMGAFVRSMDRLRDELQCHVAVVHHCGKEQSKGSRGHSLLRCAVDTEIAVARDKTTGISTATVTKQRDGIAGVQLAFRLKQVMLGNDQDGEAVISCVVTAVDVPASSKLKSAPRLSPAQRRAFELLVNSLAKGGEIPPANDHIPSNTSCVTESTWRECCYGGLITESDKPDAKRKAFKRSADALLAAGRVGKWGDYVWLVP